MPSLDQFEAIWRFSEAFASTLHESVHSTEEVPTTIAPPDRAVKIGMLELLKQAGVDEPKFSVGRSSEG